MSEYGKYIIGNAERLQKIISDILDMSKIDNNVLTLDKEQFNLNEAILSTIQDIREQIIFENKKVNIIYNSKDTKEKDIIIGDKARIIQVMSNILNNTIRFTKEGTIYIELEKNNVINNNNNDDHTDRSTSDSGSSSSTSREIIINIKDSGKGIDSRTFSHMFSKFFSTSGKGGTGLGLYISKSIIEDHGGRIWAKNNEDGKGATFSFSLPLYKQK
jgi:signal transduction histidine kinase